jgi:hypothetical protein
MESELLGAVDGEGRWRRRRKGRSIDLIVGGFERILCDVSSELIDSDDALPHLHLHPILCAQSDCDPC